MSARGTPRQRTTRRQWAKIISRDTVSFVLGWVLVFQQALGDPDRLNYALLALAAGAVGLPTTLAAFAARGTGGTPESYTPLPPPDSSPSPISSPEDEVAA